MHAARPDLQFIQPNITRTCEEREVYDTLLTLDGVHILELGCGKADHSRRIATAHPTSTVLAAEVDRIQHQANLASDRPANLTFTDFGAQAIGLPDASVEIVMMFKSLHHVPVDLLDTALAELRRVLKPGGHAYLSEPLFAGPFNELIRIFNDEEVVRRAAFKAVCEAVTHGAFTLAGQVFFNVPVHYRDFAAFEARHLVVTYAERNVTGEQAARLRRLFETHQGTDGVRLTQSMRVDLLRKPD